MLSCIQRSRWVAVGALELAGVRVLAGLVLGCAVGRVSVWVRLLGAS